MDLLTLQETMQRLSKSDSTIRRMIRKKQLPAQKIDGRYYFHLSDVIKHLPSPSNTDQVICDLSERLASLEQEVEELKQQIERLTSRATINEKPPVVSQPPKTHTAQIKASQPHSTAIPEFPDDLVTFADFYEAHGISESTARRVLKQHQESALSGNWNIGGKAVKHMLDATGRHVFYEAFKTKNSFRVCLGCPH